MARVLLRGLPAQGGFEAAYYGEPICGYLLLQFTTPSASLTMGYGESSWMHQCSRGCHKVNSSSLLGSDQLHQPLCNTCAQCITTVYVVYPGSYWDRSTAALIVTGQLLPAGTPTPVPDVASSNGNLADTDGKPTVIEGSVVCRMTFKSSSMDLLSSVDNARGAWLAQITRGSMVEGFSSQSLPLAATLPHLHSAVAPLKAAYAVPKSNSLEDFDSNTEDAAAPSVFEDVLAQEWRRLQAVVV